MSQLSYKNIVGDTVESLAKVKVNDIHCSPLVHKTSHLNTEASQVGQAWVFPGNSMLAVTNHFLLFYVSRNIFQEELLYDFPRDQSVLDTTPLVGIVPTSM